MSWKPRVQRDIEIEGSKSLSELAEAIIGAFDFDFDHAFGFYSNFEKWTDPKGERYELFADMEDTESDAGSVAQTKVAQVFNAVGKKMLFLFDYGAEWRFQVEFVAVGTKAAQRRYPRLVATKGDAPEQYPDPDDE